MGTGPTAFEFEQTHHCPSRRREERCILRSRKPGRLRSAPLLRTSWDSACAGSGEMTAPPGQATARRSKCGTLGTVRPYARRDRACSESTGQPTRGPPRSPGGARREPGRWLHPDTAPIPKTQHSRSLRSLVVTLLLPLGSGSETPVASPAPRVRSTRSVGGEASGVSDCARVGGPGGASALTCRPRRKRQLGEVA